MNTEDLHKRLSFLRQAERLKDTLRNSYTTEGKIESVAEHTWRLTLFALVFADLLPEINLLHLLKLCILHDLGEAIHGDIPASEQINKELKSTKERQDFQVLIGALPKHLEEEFLKLWDEYENAASQEAQIAKGLDKLETILQHNQGKTPHDFDFLFNLKYGKEYTDLFPILFELRSLIDLETISKIKDYEA